MKPERLAAACASPRPAGPEHVHGIAKLHSVLFEPGWDDAAVAAMLDHPASQALVIEATGSQRIVGFVLAQSAADEAEILSVGVDPNWQKEGFGTRLMTELVRRLVAIDVRRLYLEVAADNRPALACYRKLGFRQVGVRRSYYARAQDGGADALVLRLDM